VPPSTPLLSSPLCGERVDRDRSGLKTEAAGGSYGDRAYFKPLLVTPFPVMDHNRLERR
jgi:hypothetical protein